VLQIPLDSLILHTMPKKQRHTGQPAPTTASAFDNESGQVYVEAQVRINSRHHSDWIGELKTPALARRSNPASGTGTRTLAEIAAFQIAQQFRDLTADHFAALPWSLVRNVWEQVLSSHRESLHTWRVLAAAYPVEMAVSTHRYHLHIRQPSLPLESYFGGLSSQPVNWLTCLRISPKETRTADLVAVANIKNLAILDLSDGQNAIDIKTSSFNERVMRSWAEITQARQGFCYLRVLMLGWQDVDMWLFKYLPCFPSLSKVIITDSQHLTQRNRREWEADALSAGYEARHAKRSVKSLRSVLDEPHYYRCAVSGLLYEDQGQASTSASTSQPSAKPQLPVLECWLGNPRKWTHILEDFPGTRTIYFDRIAERQTSSAGLDTVIHPRITDVTKRNRQVESGASSPPYKRVPKAAPKPGKILGLADMLSGLA